MVKVLIACGSGIATSSYAAEEIVKIAKECNVKHLGLVSKEN